MKKLGEMERLDFFNGLDKYLSENTDNLYQVESILIKSSMIKVWEKISNWFEFQKAVPIICEKVVLTGEQYQINSTFSLTWPTKQVECNLKVKEINQNEENEWVFVLECYDGKPKSPRQELRFTLMKIEDSLTFIEFKHVFLEVISNNILQKIASDKQKILIGLREYLENNQ